METLRTEFDICRLYTEDAKAVLGDLYPIINGYIRSRNVKGLSESRELFDRFRHSAEVFKVLHQIQAFFKKSISFVENDACLQAATDSFEKGERRCRITNRRLTYYFMQRGRLDPDLRRKLERMEYYIRSTLGPFDEFFGDLPQRIRFTSGATATRSRRNSRPFEKVSMRVICSKACFPILRSLYLFYGYGEPRHRNVNWNRVEAVPKSWKTHRLIACEPDHMIPIQLAVDDYLKMRLRARGYNLSNQGRNRELARLASIDGSLATIDLEGASDSLSLDLVHYLFPREWCEFLMRIRSAFYRFNGRIGKYAKFSSMGNGATFTLETLVFSACCFAVGSKVNAVYGDDIVVETSKARELIELLRFIGFRTNDSKSFLEGPFRESCGGDYWQGTDITPFYVRDVNTRSNKGLLYHLINGLAGICQPGGLLWDALLAEARGLPQVPFNGVSTSGVWIDVGSAYAMKLIRVPREGRRNAGIPQYKSLVHKDRGYVVRDSRALFLWYLDKYRRPESPPVERSWETAFSTKQVRKWVCWYPPATVTPFHLYRWSDDLVRGFVPAD